MSFYVFWISYVKLFPFMYITLYILLYSISLYILCCIVHMLRPLSYTSLLVNVVFLYIWLWIKTILFYSIQFYSILFCSFLFCFILFSSLLVSFSFSFSFYSILFYSNVVLCHFRKVVNWWYFLFHNPQFQHARVSRNISTSGRCYHKVFLSESWRILLFNSLI